MVYWEPNTKLKLTDCLTKIEGSFVRKCQYPKILTYIKLASADFKIDSLKTQKPQALFLDQNHEILALFPLGSARTLRWIPPWTHID